MIEGRCRYCKSPRPERAPLPGKASCETCCAKKNAKKAAIRPLRLCKTCNVRPAAPRCQTCPTCIEAAAMQRLLKQRSEYRMRVGNPVDAPLGKMRDRRGECTRCTASVLPGRDVCREHHETLAQIRRERTG